MCINNPQHYPLEKVQAFKVMVKSTRHEGSYRPVFALPSYYDDRNFYKNELYLCKNHYGFHACLSYEDAIKIVKTNINKWDLSMYTADNLDKLVIVLVELSDNICYGQNDSKSPLQVKGNNMKILGEVILN